MIREVDEDGNGTIDFGEFLEMMARKLNKIDIEAELLEAFKVFDRDGNGLVSTTEVRFTLHSITHLSHDEIDDIITKADLDGDGHIKFEEFIRVLFA